MTNQIDRDALETEYAFRLQTFERLLTEGIYEIQMALNAVGIKVHTLHGRVKSFDSLLSKARRKSFADPFAELTDIVGIRIVAVFLGDLVRIQELVGGIFDIQSADDKIQSISPSEFGYMSVHLIGRIKANFFGTRYDSIKNLSFEIQIRTIAMDAWAAASHYLDYKSEADVPSELKRDFHALSGLFYVADQHFELFFKARAATKKTVEEQLESTVAPLLQPINLDTVTAFLKRKYPDRKLSQEDGISELVNSLNEAQIHTLGQLDELLNKKRDAFLAYEKNFPPTASRSKRYEPIGVVRLSLLHLPDFEPQQDRSNYEGLGPLLDEE